MRQDGFISPTLRPRANTVTRVLWVTGNFRPEIGGIQLYTERMLEAFANWYALGLVTERRHEPPGRGIDHFPLQYLTRPRNGAEWEGARAGIANCVTQHRAGIVHLSNANLAVYRDAIPKALPVVCTVHGNDLTAPWQLTPEEDARPRIVEGLNACAHIVAVSNHTAALVRSAGVRSCVTVLNHGCDTTFFFPMHEASRRIRDAYGIGPTCPILLTVARLVSRKGHATVLKALEMLSSLPQPPHWIVAGAGPLSHWLQQEARCRGLDRRITLTGAVSDEVLRRLYNACDVFVLVPTERRWDGRLDSEGFGLVFLEAAACGKPAIGSDLAGCRDAVIHGHTGLLVPPDEPSALADLIAQLLEQPEWGKALGNAGLVRVRATGSWLQVAERLGSIYSRLVMEMRTERTLMNSYRI
jgi:phosphatidylinositol alpha-1,6-mannosyltransferase